MREAGVEIALVDGVVRVGLTDVGETPEGAPGASHAGSHEQGSSREARHTWNT